MEALPGEAQAAQRLRQTALRDFGRVVADDTQDPRWDGVPAYRMAIDPDDAPVPFLYKYALNLVGCPAYGPGEKVAWWVNFTYRGERCSLAFQKFGLRLYLRTERPEEEALETQRQIAKQLRSSMRTIERLIVNAAPDLLGKGAATVRNQHTSLRRAYDYFRERAEQPVLIEDVRESGESEGGGTWRTFQSGQTQMQLNSFHDMIAAITAFLSLLEHDLVLALAFADFDPDEDDLTAMIGSRWAEKWEWLAIAVFVVFLAPWWIVLGMAAWSPVAFAGAAILARRAHGQTPPTGGTSAGVRSRWPRAMQPFTIGLVVVSVVTTSVQERPWLPAERISGPDQTTVGYVLDESVEGFIVLTLEDRRVVRVPANESTTRTLCVEPRKIESVNNLDVFSEMTPLYGLYRLGRGLNNYAYCNEVPLSGVIN